MGIMAQQSFSFLSSRSRDLSPAAMGATLLIYLALSLGQVFLALLNPVFGLISALAINLIMLLFIQSELALPLYILLADPTVVLSASSSGILSRLYIGNLLFVLIVGIWLLRVALSERKARLVRGE